MRDGGDSQLRRCDTSVVTRGLGWVGASCRPFGALRDTLKRCPNGTPLQPPTHPPPPAPPLSPVPTPACPLSSLCSRLSSHSGSLTLFCTSHIAPCCHHELHATQDPPATSTKLVPPPCTPRAKAPQSEQISAKGGDASTLVGDGQSQGCKVTWRKNKDVFLHRSSTAEAQKRSPSRNLHHRGLLGIL